jgi:hypothetical protein
VAKQSRLMNQNWWVRNAKAAFPEKAAAAAG